MEQTDSDSEDEEMDDEYGELVGGSGRVKVRND